MNNPPLPISQAFLICQKIEQGQVVSLSGLVNTFQSRNFPAATSLGFFGRLTSAHGDYAIEIQLQTSEGEVVWRDGPPKPWSLKNPLQAYDLKLTMCPSFPDAGTYNFVLMANGEEVARQRFHVQAVRQTAQK